MPTSPWPPPNLPDCCSGDLHPLALKGIRLFNAGDYFAAHEELELAWRAEKGPIRELYRGILQVGVSYYHIRRLNYRGAVKMLSYSKFWLEPFPDQCRGVDLAQLRRDALRVEAALLSTHPDQLSGFDQSLFHPVRVHGDTTPAL